MLTRDSTYKRLARCSSSTVENAALIPCSSPNSTNATATDSSVNTARIFLRVGPAQRGERNLMELLSVHLVFAPKRSTPQLFWQSARGIPLPPVSGEGVREKRGGGGSISVFWF